ncbi:Leucine-rich repeat-containing protein 3, partial [Calypte anna]
QAFFCLLLCVPWGSSCPPSCQCTERAGAKAVVCSSRHLEEIPEDIPRDAVFLKLDTNSITRIPGDAFRHLSLLEELDLSRNAIEQIEAAAFRGVAARLRTLDLSGNRIRSIPQEGLLGLVGKPLLQVLDAGVDLCGARRGTPDVAVLVTMFGWFAMVIGYLICYVRHNQEDACKRMDYLRALPGTQGHAD